MTNYYKVFYWLTVADGVKSFFNVFSNIATVLSVVALVFIIIMTLIKVDNSDTSQSEEDKVSFQKWFGYFKSLFIYLSTITLILWAGYVFVPSKQDCYVIVAGGAVGNFITSDSAAKKIPSEALQLLRDKIREESKSISIKGVEDTLANKSKEQLIELLKQKK